MNKKRYLKKRVYRVKQKLGGMEVYLKWCLPEGKEGTPNFISFRLAGTVNGKLRAAQADLPAECIPDWIELGEKLQTEEFSAAGLTLGYAGNAVSGQLWWLELSCLEGELRKPWEFRLYTAAGNEELTLSEPIRVQVSEQTLRNLVRSLG